MGETRGFSLSAFSAMVAHSRSQRVQGQKLASCLHLGVFGVALVLSLPYCRPPCEVGLSRALGMGWWVCLPHFLVIRTAERGRVCRGLSTRHGHLPRRPGRRLRLILWVWPALRERPHFRPSSAVVSIQGSSSTVLSVRKRQGFHPVLGEGLLYLDLKGIFFPVFLRKLLKLWKPVYCWLLEFSQLSPVPLRSTDLSGALIGYCGHHRTLWAVIGGPDSGPVPFGGK